MHIVCDKNAGLCLANPEVVAEWRQTIVGSEEPRTEEISILQGVKQTYFHIRNQDYVSLMLSLHA